ncbi:MAG: DUF481 domain-containing protein [Pseudomonadota bacterium]
MILGFVLSTAAISSSFLNGAHLDEASENWDGNIQFNVSSATGNTDNTVLGGKFNARRTFGRITHDFQAGGNYAEATTQNNDGTEDNEVTQNNWFTQYRLEGKLSERTFAFGRLRYEQDEFSGFDERAFVGVGLGHALIKSDRQQLDMLIGPGFQYAKLATPDPMPEEFEEQQTSAALFLGESYTLAVRENVTFEQSFDATFAEDNTTLANILSLKTNLTEKISSRISYQVKHETDPPEGREQTDTLLTASIGYDF